VWTLRIVWATLPATAGPAVSAAVHEWSDPPRVLAEVLLWCAWAVGLLAVFAPRPIGLTALRIIAPAFAAFAIAVAIGGEPTVVESVAAVIATLGASVLASGHDIAIASVNATSYGDEQRMPLKVPPALFLAPIPAARAAVVAGTTAGPLLLADGRVVAGLVALVVGVPVVVLLLRSLHGLSRRFAVLVPAGFVVVDPMTLADPILLPRERILEMQAAPATVAPEGVLDLRLGATSGSVSLRFDQAAEVTTAARARRPAVTVRATELWIAVVRRTDVLRSAAGRRIRVVASDAT
jgi:hypothetical protein